MILKDKRKKIAEDISKGIPLPEVAKKRGVSVGSVYAICREFGVGFCRNGKTLASSTYQVIADLINTDDSLKTIGDRLGITKQRVSLILQECKKAGVPVRVRQPIHD